MSAWEWHSPHTCSARPGRRCLKLHFLSRNVYLQEKSPILLNRWINLAFSKLLIHNLKSHIHYLVLVSKELSLEPSCLTKKQGTVKKSHHVYNSLSKTMFLKWIGKHICNSEKNPHSVITLLKDLGSLWDTLKVSFPQDVWITLSLGKGNWSELLRYIQLSNPMGNHLQVGRVRVSLTVFAAPWMLWTFTMWDNMRQTSSLLLKRRSSWQN